MQWYQLALGGSLALQPAKTCAGLSAARAGELSPALTCDGYQHSFGGQSLRCRLSDTPEMPDLVTFYWSVTRPWLPGASASLWTSREVLRATVPVVPLFFEAMGYYAWLRQSRTWSPPGGVLSLFSLTITVTLPLHVHLSVPQWPSDASETVGWAHLVARLPVHRHDVAYALLVCGEGQEVTLVQ